jgi:PTS system ascorbate-specific IIB component
VRTLKVLAVCGVGMGSSLILKMTTEDALRRIGVTADVEHADLSSARGIPADVIVGQGMHTDELVGQAPVVVAVTNFVDTDGLETELRRRLAEQGWI